MTGLSWSLDLDLPTWLVVPADSFDEARWRTDARVLFDLVAEIDVAMPQELRRLSQRTTFDADGALDVLLEFARTLPEGHRLVAGLAVADRWPLPVVVRVSLSGDDPDDLLEAAGARGGTPVEAPIVDYLPEELGDGIRVTRFDLDEDGVLWASVSCARREGGVDTVLTWRTVDLAVVPEFEPQLTSLLAGVRVAKALA